MIRVGILEDNLTFGAFLGDLIAAQPDMDCAFNVPTLREAFDLFAPDRVDLLLIDIQLPDGSGIDLVSRAARTAPACHLLMMTMLHDRASVLAAFEAGAHGYLLKDSPPDKIVASIRETRLGESPISSAAARHLLSQFKRPGIVPSKDGLTSREAEVLHLLSRGLSYAEAAGALSLSIHTFRDHIKAIYRKLDVNSKTEAVFEARQQGIIGRFD